MSTVTKSTQCIDTGQGETLTNKYEVAVHPLNVAVPIVEHLFDFVHLLRVMKE